MNPFDMDPGDDPAAWVEDCIEWASSQVMARLSLRIGILGDLTPDVQQRLLDGFSRYVDARARAAARQMVHAELWRMHWPTLAEDVARHFRSTELVYLAPARVIQLQNLGTSRAINKGEKEQDTNSHIIGAVGEGVFAEWWRLPDDARIHHGGDDGDFRLSCGCIVDVKTTLPGRSLLVSDKAARKSDIVMLVWMHWPTGPFGVVGWASREQIATAVADGKTVTLPGRNGGAFQGVQFAPKALQTLMAFVDHVSTHRIVHLPPGDGGAAQATRSVLAFPRDGE